MKCLIPVIVFFLALAVAAWGLDPSLREARLQEMAGDREGAGRLYAYWLDANPGSAQAPAVFDRFFTSEQDLPSLLDVGKKFIKDADRGIHLPESMAMIARLFEVAGMTQDARDAFLSAFAHGGSLSSLESAFLLSLEMNDIDSLQSGLAAMKDDENERVEFLRVCLSLQKGEYGPAATTLNRLADTATDQTIALKSLWLGYRLAVRSGDPAARQVAVRRLQSRFPRSPEYALAAAESSTADLPLPANISVMALPERFFSAATDSSPAEPGQTDQAPSGRTPQDQAPQKTLSVQIGSFQMKGNADDLIGELARKGFSPTLRTDAQQGKPLYRVFAGIGLAAEDARALLEKLHDAGFSGFLLKDQ